MTVSYNEAQRLVRDILSSNDEILGVAVIDRRSGHILASESRAPFKERFEVDGLRGGDSNSNSSNSYGGTLAVATLSVVREAKAAFGEPQAIITVHKNCKLMLLPVLSYDILVVLVLERSADADDDNLANKVERLVARTFEP